MLLAHELVHELHERSFGTTFGEFDLDISIETRDIIEGMDSLEEQHTVIGINHFIFQKKDALTHLDVLCENAFLFALGLPPRIDHGPARSSDLYQKTDSNASQMEEFFSLLERVLKIFSSFPPILLEPENKEALILYIVSHPFTLPFIPDELRNNEALFLELVTLSCSLVKLHAPQLASSPCFVLKALRKTPQASYLITQDLAEDKAFALDALRINRRIFPLLAPSLQSDPDLLALKG